MKLESVDYFTDPLSARNSVEFVLAFSSKPECTSVSLVSLEDYKSRVSLNKSQKVPKDHCCIGCLSKWINYQNGEIAGVAHEERGCFNGCGARITKEKLSKLLTSDAYHTYCETLTRVGMRRNLSTVWCRCGTVYQMGKSFHFCFYC